MAPSNFAPEISAVARLALLRSVPRILLPQHSLMLLKSAPVSLVFVKSAPSKFDDLNTAFDRSEFERFDFTNFVAGRKLPERFTLDKSSPEKSESEPLEPIPSNLVFSILAPFKPEIRACC